MIAGWRAWLRTHAFAIASTLIALCLCVPSLYAFWRVAQSRLNEGYALWWLEPLFYRAALAFDQGLPLYPPPSLEYTPPIYNPGLSIVGGALIGALDDGYPTLRWFSFVCFVMLACVIAVWSWRHTRDLATSVIALTLIVSLQSQMGRWITAINTDTPSLLFGFVGVCLAACVPPKNARASWVTCASIVAGLCITLGFAFKQPACLLALPAFSVLALRDIKQAWWFALSCGGSALLMIGALWLSSDGWYWTYAFTIPTATAQRVLPDLWLSMLRPHGLSALGGVIAAPLLTWLGPRALRGLWLPLIASTWLMAYAGFTKDGGDVNTLLPAYVAGVMCLCALPSCALPFTVSNARWQALTSSVLVALLVIGAGLWTRDATTWFRNRAKGLEAHTRARVTYPQQARFERELQATIAKLPQPVFVGGRFFGAGGPLNTHQSGLYEGMSRTSLFDVGTLIAPRLQQHHYKSLVLWSYWHNDVFDALVSRYYKRDRKLGADPLIGLHVHVWHPRH